MEEQKENLFQSLWPSMFKHTRLLLIDYDVLRYHSFDLLRYQLAQDSKNGMTHHFYSLSPKAHAAYVAGPNADKNAAIHTFQGSNENLNVYDNFAGYPKVDFPFVYEQYLHRLFGDTKVPITRTDIYHTFHTIFARNDVTGYILRYADDPNLPNFDSSVKIINTSTMLSMMEAADVIVKHRINAVMMSSMELCMALIERLSGMDYKSAITFMVGVYQYNYEFDEGLGMMVPKYNDECAALQYTRDYEFAYFDPFTGITSQYIMKEQIKEDEKHEGNHPE